MENDSKLIDKFPKQEEMSDKQYEIFIKYIQNEIEKENVKEDEITS